MQIKNEIQDPSVIAWVTVNLTEQEARVGCRKEIFAEGMLMPVYVEFQPGTRDGQRSFLRDIPFMAENGLAENGALGLCIQVPQKKKKIWLPILAGILAVVIQIGAIAGLVGWAMAKYGQMDQGPADDHLYYQGEKLDPASVFPHYALRYYLSQLDPLKQQAACILYKAVMEFQPECAMPKGLHKDDFVELVMILKSECPEMIQLDLVNDMMYHYNAESGNVYSASFTYRVSKETYGEMRQAVGLKANSLRIQTERMEDREKEEYIFRMLASKITYDTEAENVDNAYGALIGGKAKCDGIAHALKWCLEEAGIQTLCILGDARQEGEVGHAWNMVYMDGMFRNVDLTASVNYADSTAQYQKATLYLYFNVADHWFEEKFTVIEALDHWIPKPVCDTDDGSYQAYKQQSIRRDEDLEKQFKEFLYKSYSSRQGISIQLDTDDMHSELRNKLRSYYLEALNEYDMRRAIRVDYVFLERNVVWIQVIVSGV